MKELIILAKAAKQLANLPLRDRDVLISKLKRYAAGQKEGLDVQKLQGREGFRLRHGIWRAIFNEDFEIVSVIKVGHRRDIY